MQYENSKLEFNSLKISWVIILLLILLCNSIIYIIFNNLNFYLNINELLCLSLGICIAMVPVMKKIYIKNLRIIYFAIGEIFSSICIVIKVFLMQYCNLDVFDSNIIKIKFLIICIYYFFSITLEYLNKFKIKKIKLCCICSSYIVLLFIFANSVKCSLKYLSIVVAFLVICDIFNSYYIGKFYKNNRLICKLAVFNQVINYSFTIAFIISLFYGERFIVISSVLRVCLYIYKFKFIQEIVLKKIFNNVHEKLICIESSNIDMNIKLKDRNKILTEFKKQIASSESKYRQILFYLQDGVIIINNGKVKFVNGSMKNVVDNNSNALINKIIKKCNNHKSRIFTSGDLKYQIFYVRISNNEQMYYLKDITNINKAYEERKNYCEFLQKEKSKNQFYSNISHELRTPINLIYSAVQLNDIYIKRYNLMGIYNNNIAIKHNCLRLIRTITNFIDANKISEGYMKANLAIYNIVSVIENISLACKKYIDYIHDTLIFDSVKEEIYVKCDKDMIERIMMNLLSNIVKYGKSNGNIYINIEIKNNNVIVILRVDNYTIKDEYKKIMFDKFTKLNKEFTRSREGSGLGLYLVKELLKLNKGSIAVKTNRNEGTSFIIKMPISKVRGSIDDESMFETDYLDEKVDTEFSDIYL